MIRGLLVVIILALGGYMLFHQPPHTSSQTVAPSEIMPSFTCDNPLAEPVVTEHNFDRDQLPEKIISCDNGGSIGFSNLTIFRMGTKIDEVTGIGPAKYEDRNGDGFDDIVLSNRADGEVDCSVKANCFDKNSNWRYREIIFFWQDSTKDFSAEAKGNWED